MADKFFEAEQQIMASIVQGHETDLLPNDLRDGPHQMIVEACHALRDSGVTPDVITIKHWISDHRGEENFGDFDYLNTLRDMYANPKRQGVYEAIIKEQALRQRVIAHAKGLLHAEEDGAKTDELLAWAQTEPMAFGAGRASANVVLAQDVAYDVLEEVQLRRGSDKLTGLETPWKKLNEITRGLHRKDLIIIAGRPSMGKTALAAQIGTFAAQRAGPVFIGSLEMDRSSLVERMLVGAARIDGDRVRAGYMTQDEYESLQVAAERLQDHHPIVINDSPRLSAQELRMSIAQAHLKYKGLQVAIVDYLGLIKEDDVRRQRYQHVGEAAKLLRATAKDLDIPVVLVCQLNRDCEKRENKRPILADLRESGDIEQDSDVIIMLYRDEYYCQDCQSYNDECGKDHIGIAEAIVRKQRKGPTGTAALGWDAKYTQFNNIDWSQYDGDNNMATGPVESDFALPGESGSDSEAEPKQREITF
jgi:replicative DNA helicase